MIYPTIAYIALGLYLYITPMLLKQIWPSEITNYSLFYVISLQCAHLGTYIYVNLYYYIIYHIEHPFFEQYKVEEKPWPWKENQSFWQELRSNTFTNFIQNQIIGLTLAYLTSLTSQFRVNDDSFPSYFEICWQIVFFAIIEDFCFYWSHRMLHTPALYSKIHKLHHTYKVTITISAEFAHPIEYILGNLLPVFAGPTLLGSQMHQMTLLVWMGLVIHKTLSDHSGYQFPWVVYHHLIGSTNSDFHSYHHSVNIGNYSSTFVYLDKFLGTSSLYDNYKKQKV